MVLSTPLFEHAPAARGLAAASCAALTLAAGELRGSAPGLLRSHALRRLGELSYAVYLVHWPAVLLLSRGELLPERPGPRALLVMAVSLAAAWVLHRGVERPGRSLPVAERPSQRLAVLVALLLSVSIAAGAYSLRVGHADAERWSRSGWAASTPWRELHVVPAPPGAPRVLLLGDSQADSWWPAVEALARREGWHVGVLWAPSCSWIPGCHGPQSSPTRCETNAWAPTRRALETFQPDRILLADRVSEDCDVDGEGADRVERVTRAGRALLEGEALRDAEVVIIEPIPRLSSLPYACVDADMSPERCDPSPDRSPGSQAIEAAWRAEAAARTRWSTLDLDGLVCPDEACLYVSEGRFVRPTWGTWRRTTPGARPSASARR